MSACHSDVFTAGKGVRVGDDGEQMPAYYQQWADKIKDMSPARQADVLDQLGEDDRYAMLHCSFVFAVLSAMLLMSNLRDITGLKPMLQTAGMCYSFL